MAARREGLPGLKIVLLGDVSVGAKTSLLKRFVSDTFQEFQEATIGAAFAAKHIVVDGAEVTLEIWGLHTTAHWGKRGNGATALVGGGVGCTQTQQDRRSSARWQRCTIRVHMPRFWAST